MHRWSVFSGSTSSAMSQRHFGSQAFRNFRHQVYKTDNFPKVKKELEKVPFSAIPGIISRAFKALSSEQIAELSGGPTQKGKQAWVAAHKDDEVFAGLGQQQKTEAMDKQWKQMNSPSVAARSVRARELKVRKAASSQAFTQPFQIPPNYPHTAVAWPQHQGMMMAAPYYQQPHCPPQFYPQQQYQQRPHFFSGPQQYPQHYQQQFQHQMMPQHQQGYSQRAGTVGSSSKKVKRPRKEKTVLPEAVSGFEMPEDLRDDQLLESGMVSELNEAEASPTPKKKTANRRSYKKKPPPISTTPEGNVEL